METRNMNTRVGLVTGVIALGLTFVGTSVIAAGTVAVLSGAGTRSAGSALVAPIVATLRVLWQ
jgi:hypothetical protein